MFKVVTLYKFISLTNLTILQQQLQTICRSLTGTLLIAPEGINGTIAGLPTALEQAMAQIQTIPFFQDLFYQYSEATVKPFCRLKVRIKKEIITMTKAAAAQPMQLRGCHVSAKDWNALLDEAALIVDVRNHYEHRIGSFTAALNPNTTYFSEFPAFVDRHLTAYKQKPIALFCTGGIRCEKASAYMCMVGFQEVYQLSGGILQYIAHIPESETKWEGACFVFDRRVALKQGLAESDTLLCYGCRMPLAAADLDEQYQPGKQCKYCSNKATA
ncbi:rhodanese-related sulfurtransferase [Candidatus Cardinium hertigii]|uniref:tRNA uridine(34) hydroxylase n=1 Tax=Candidatus Cardinium hertigii TaxID=247481 RepID=A0A2Z3L8S2_9BACT|nr:rhodanese-like domain-containing protein [Candidatus Cardinium hertigii]AWN81978.1 hypothetical protein DK880_00664 [Candidatus Cardinium hertigii]